MKKIKFKDVRNGQSFYAEDGRFSIKIENICNTNSIDNNGYKRLIHDYSLVRVEEDKISPLVGPGEYSFGEMLMIISTNSSRRFVPIQVLDSLDNVKYIYFDCCGFRWIPKDSSTPKPLVLDKRWIFQRYVDYKEVGCTFNDIVATNRFEFYGTTYYKLSTPQKLGIYTYNCMKDNVDMASKVLDYINENAEVKPL